MSGFSAAESTRFVVAAIAVSHYHHETCTQHTRTWTEVFGVSYFIRTSVVDLSRSPRNPSFCFLPIWDQAAPEGYGGSVLRFHE